MVLVILFILFTLNRYFDSLAVSGSQISREKLQNTKWELHVEDDLGWLDPGRVGEGLKAFWQETGVVPYVMLVDDRKAFEEHDSLESMAEAVFDERGLNEDMMLFLVASHEDSDDYYGWITLGHEAALVMDKEAQDILTRHFRSWWDKDPGSVTETQLFSRAFRDAGKSIMRAAPPWWLIPAALGLLILCVLAAIVALNARTKKIKAEAELAKKTEEVLKTPLEELGSKRDDVLNKWS
jgi:hypothetical protein